MITECSDCSSKDKYDKYFDIHNTELNNLNKNKEKLGLSNGKDNEQSNYISTNSECGTTSTNIFKLNNLELIPPFKKYNFFIHPNSYNESITDKKQNEIKLEAIQYIIRILLGKVVDNVRMSDFCVTNRLDKVDKIPSHIRKVNVDFLQDCLIEYKLLSYDNKKYQPLEFKKR